LRNAKLIEAECQSDSINIGVSMFFATKFIKKILKEYRNIAKNIRNNQLNYGIDENGIRERIENNNLNNINDFNEKFLKGF
jgi:hypothetical protein